MVRLYNGPKDGDSIAAMPPNRVFFPQGALARWLDEGKVELSGESLTMCEEGHSYRIVEAARVVREVTGAPDAHELQGRVKSRIFLLELGAEIVEESMILGENAYDIVPGFLGTLIAPAPPATKPQEIRPKSVPPEPPKKPASDEDLLIKFLLKGL